MNLRIPAAFVLLIITILASCKRDHYRVNTSGISVSINVMRLEKDLFTADPAALASALPGLKKKYGESLQLFSYVINAGNINDSSFTGILESFCTNKLNNEVYSAVVQAYPDLDKLGKDLEEAFRHYLYYFPSARIPSVFTCMSGFNRSIITLKDSVLGIGLERYLGRNCEYYRKLDIYKYLAARMNFYNILPDCMYAWGTAEWDFEDMKYPADNVLAEMIHQGKLRYFEKCMLPALDDTLIFGFTADQMKFCRNNERQMWEYILENDMLFKTDQFLIRKLTGEAPFTSYFTNESPGRAATWLGFRIVESYMLKNKGVSLGALMADTDVQGIMEKAKYRPG